MINGKTAFIIGAGAHVPYNMPTGKKLREQIISSSVNHDYFKGLNIQEYDSGKYKDFCDSFRHSNIASIDRFLQMNPDYKLEGKIAILFCIKQNESSNYKSTLNDQWIQFLYNKMIEGIKSNTEYELFNNNNVYFCTFNYDRLFDWAIYTSLLNTFGTNAVIKQVYQENGFDGLSNIFKIKIDHVYGQIGTLNENPIDEEDYSFIKSNIDNIYLIEERERDITNIINELGKADKIYFLGYGFNNENNSLLNINRILENKKGFATGKGFYVEELNRLQSKIKCTIRDFDSYELIRKFDLA